MESEKYTESKLVRREHCSIDYRHFSVHLPLPQLCEGWVFFVYFFIPISQKKKLRLKGVTWSSSQHGRSSVCIWPQSLSLCSRTLCYSQTARLVLCCASVSLCLPLGPQTKGLWAERGPRHILFDQHHAFSSGLLLFLSMLM